MLGAVEARRGTNNSEIINGVVVYASYTPGEAVTVWNVDEEDGSKEEMMSDLCEVPYCTIQNEDGLEVCASEYKCRRLVNGAPLKMKIALSATAVFVIAVIIMCLTCRKSSCC